MSPKHSSGEKPNFLLIITDQQRADHVGAYGNTVVRTPNLDAIAARGWTAERFYVASPACMPNRASLMTGRLPSVHGARHNGIPLSLGATTFVELLRDAGWRTSLVGKSHLQNMCGLPAAWPPADKRLPRQAHAETRGNYWQEWGPTWRDTPGYDMDLPFYGFDDVALAVDHGDQVQGHYWRWLQAEHPEVAAVAGPEHAIPAPEWSLTRAKQAWRTRVPEECSTTSWITNETIRRLGDFAREGEPFFLKASFPDPHHPFTPPGRFWGMYQPDDVDLPASFHARGEPPPHVAWLRAQRDAARAIKHTPAAFACNEREAREAIALNYGSITHIDESIGRMLSELKRLGLADNTVVIFTSDHGDFLGDHQLLLKGPLHYQSLVRTPFIWADPAKPGAERSQALCSTIDLGPTVLARAGVTPFNGMQGQVLPCVEGAAQPPRQSVLLEDEVQRVLFGFDTPPRLRTLITARWRLTVYANSAWGELYDLENDPHELRNLWEDAGHRAVRGELMTDLVRQMTRHGDTSPYASALA
jgi:arylsulfatase A-like enzyme